MGPKALVTNSKLKIVKRVVLKGAIFGKISGS